MALVALAGMTHGPCGVLLEDALRTDLTWRVHTEGCVPCGAIHQVKEQYHEAQKDQDGKSDVHRRLWWVEKSPLSS